MLPIGTVAAIVFDVVDRFGDVMVAEGNAVLFVVVLVLVLVVAEPVSVCLCPFEVWPSQHGGGVRKVEVNGATLHTDDNE